MGRFNRLPGISEENTTRRNVLIGSGYVFGGVVVLGGIVSSGEDDGIEADTPTGDTPTDGEEPDDDPTGIERLLEHTFSDPGAMITIAPGGNHALFGLHPVDRFIGYDIVNEEFTTTDGGVGEPAQVDVRDDGYATVAWWEDNTIGGIDSTTGNGPEWTTQYDDLMEVDVNADHSDIAVIGGDIWGGPGRVGIIAEGGDTTWDVSLEDAFPTAVAVSHDSEHVAVGTTFYWDEDAEEERGSLGVRMVDGSSSEELWRHELDNLDEEPVNVTINEQNEIVVVETLDDRIIALNHDGDTLWETNGQALLDLLSNDGSTVIARDEQRLVAYDTTDGEIRWQSDAEFSGVGFSWISEDGSRVAATSRFEDERRLYIIHEGEIVWMDERQNHASMDISADGMTWGIIENDGDASEANVEVYRDHGQ